MKRSAVATVIALAALGTSSCTRPIAAPPSTYELTVVTTPPPPESIPATTTTVAPTAPVSSTVPPAPPPTTVPPPPTTLPPIPRQPLTGAPLADGEPPINRPALVVKIDNAPSARRNHVGLGQTDIVFEEIVEANITRFAAVFHSQAPERVGPIRSGRSQDVDLLTSLNHPLFAWSGGNPGVENLIAASPLIDLNWQRGGQGYYRGSGKAPHNLYNSAPRLWEQTPPDSAGAPPQQFNYLRPDETFVGEPSGGLDVKMRDISVAWRWDPTTGRFMRSQGGSPHIDQATGPIGATNVIVLAVVYQPSKIDTRSPEAQTLSESGPAWVLSNGQLKVGRWLRTDPNRPFHLVDNNDNNLLLTPGNTWIELAEAFPGPEAAHPDVNLTLVPPAG